MKLSVIIPTYRDWPRLRLCLDALAAQTLPREDYEILVIDNDADTHQPPELPAGACLLHAPEGFSYAARNVGAAAAQGEVLAFTDADCIPEPDWLGAGLRALDAHPDWQLAAGDIAVFSDTPNSVYRYEVLFEFQQATWVRDLHFGATANLFVRRTAFDAVQGFDASMKSGGDADFCHRCHAAGLTLGFAGEAVIRHPSRHRLVEVLQKNRRIAAGFYGHALRDYRGDRAAIARQWLGQWWRPRPREWWHILSGRRGSSQFPLHQRFGVLGLHVLLRYHTAWCILRTHLSEGRSHHDVR